eukprot:TRINITY_DN23968_c0_g1_i5.p1 TRINITY_DN23968_c0_g1~~TRINITY_DN23968_c0_g1_i5.p1  ORF type:complete len:252 (-),score=28.52 TRINITY_DN23968_c0_g1_i5:264-1019(-)
MSMLITSFADERFTWNCSPSQQPPQHHIDPESKGAVITITPTPGLDYWSKTFYDPLLIKHDAPCLLAPVPADMEATLTTAFTLTPKAQFDQSGIMVFVDESTWVKAGIEFTDGSPRLSCVVTNQGFSDWSTQEMPKDWRSPSSDASSSISIRVRVHKLLPGGRGSAQGPAMVFEAAAFEDGLPDCRSDAASVAWTQVRIASLRSADQPWRMGIFAISPIEAAGCSAVFHHVELGPKQAPVHDADAGLEKAA